MRIPALLALLVSVSSARAEDFAFRADAPPSVLGRVPGAVRLRYPAEDLTVLSRAALVVELEPGAASPEALERLGVPLGASRRWWLVPVEIDAEMPEALARWAVQPGVARVTPDLVLPKRAMTVAFDDPRYTGQWYHEELISQELWGFSLGDPNTRVAVIDSAIELAHPDLQGAFLAPRDTFDEDDDPSPNPGEFCFSGGGICDEHGTAVSGIIGARANNGEGIVGFCPTCTLIPIKMLGEGQGSLSSDIAAFEHAIDNDAAVINNSWGFVEATPVPATLASVIRRAATEPRGGLGALVVFAAGNDDRTLGDDEHTALPEVLCVSATDRYGNPTAYTNRGASVALAAPSATVTTSYEAGYTETFGGTSAAAPVVSGVAGWLLSVRPDLSAEEARAMFVESAVPSPLVTPDANGHHDIYGYGELDLLALRQLALPDEGRLGACGCAAGGPSGGALPGLLALFALRRRWA
jgi:subtilisin family serine protease